MNTIIQCDAINCFKLIHSQFKQTYYEDLVKYAPPQICLFLKDDKKLFGQIIYRHAGNKELAKYFCSVDYSDFTQFYLVQFQRNRNTIPAAFINVIYFKNYDQLEIVWPYLSHSQKLIADLKRVEKEDWNELMDFPWNGFVKIHTYPLHDILLYAYPENTWLLRWNAPFIVNHIQKNVLKLVRIKDDWNELMAFPWNGFVKIHTYPLHDILLYAYPENTWLLRWNAPFIINYIQKKYN
jgi:hypothetical protein